MTSLDSHQMEALLDDYVRLASKNEDLKSEERLLSTVLNNLKVLRELLIEKERAFCSEDESIRGSLCGRVGVKDSIRRRCYNLIDHLVHYKCIIECLRNDVLNMKADLIDDDEYLRISLTHRDIEQSLLQAIRVNQKRNQVFLRMHDEEAQSYLNEIECKWRAEHEERRRLLSKTMQDHRHFLNQKATRNLEQQHELLNERYKSISNLIKPLYTQLDSTPACDHNNNNVGDNIVGNKNGV